MKKTQKTKSNTMTKPKIRTAYNVKHNEGKVFTMPSLTVPDLQLTMRELIDRIGNGVGVTGLKPVYASEIFEEIGRDPRTLDLVQVQEMQQYFNDKVRTMRQEIYEQNQAIKEAKKQRAIAEREKMFKEWEEHNKKQSALKP